MEETRVLDEEWAISEERRGYDGSTRDKRGEGLGQISRVGLTAIERGTATGERRSVKDGKAMIEEAAERESRSRL